jgi:hypothetical protein
MAAEVRKLSDSEIRGEDAQARAWEQEREAPGPGPEKIDFSLVSVGLLVSSQSFSREACGNERVKVRGGPHVFAVIFAQLVTQPSYGWLRLTKLLA